MNVSYIWIYIWMCHIYMNVSYIFSFVLNAHLLFIFKMLTTINTQSIIKYRLGGRKIIEVVMFYWGVYTSSNKEVLNKEQQGGFMVRDSHHQLSFFHGNIILGDHLWKKKIGSKYTNKIILVFYFFPKSRRHFGIKKSDRKYFKIKQK